MFKLYASLIILFNWHVQRKNMRKKLHIFRCRVHLIRDLPAMARIQSASQTQRIFPAFEYPWIPCTDAVPLSIKKDYGSTCPARVQTSFGAFTKIMSDLHLKSLAQITRRLLSSNRASSGSLSTRISANSHCSF